MKVSIITSVYNNKETIKNAIESVLNQTYKNIEYIIIDGKGSDGTVEIVKSYGSAVTKFISESNKCLKNIISPPAYKIEAILTQTSGETEIY